jgi:type IV secretion system protein VirB10
MATEPETGVIRDQRDTTPRRRLSQGAKGGLMVGCALVVVAALAMRPAPAAPPVEARQPAPQALEPERVAQQEQRLLELQQRRMQASPAMPVPLMPAGQSDAREAGFAMQAGYAAPPPPVDPIAEAQRRKEYESLFASNVVLSTRPDAERLMRTPTPPQGAGQGDGRLPAMPSVQDVAREVAAAMQGASGAAQAAPPAPARPNEPAPSQAPPAAAGNRPPASGTHRVFEGTVLDGVLANRLEGSLSGPVNVVIRTPVYAQDLTLVIPAGARVLGSAKRVTELGEERLAVAFHRVVLPNGRDIPLTQFIGLNQVGDVGLKDRVNHHYLATFGASAAVGIISGLGQLVSGGFSRGDNSGTVVVAGSVGDATSQAISQTMNRFLNRLPSVVIREGKRVAVYVTADLDLPAYGGGE